MAAALSWTNHFTTAGLTFTPSSIVTQMTSSSYDSAYPAINALNPDPSKFTRFNFVRNGTVGGTAEIAYHWTTVIGGMRDVRVYAAMNVFIPPTATNVQLILRDYALSNLFIASFSMASMVPIPGVADYYNLYVQTDSVISAGGVALYADLPTGLTSYLQVGHWWAGPALLFDEGMDADWKLGYADPSAVERARGGALIANQIPRRRTLDCSIGNRTYASAMGTPGTAGNLSYREFMGVAGKSKPVIIIPRTPVVPASPTAEEIHASQTMGMYASFVGSHEIGHQGGNLFRAMSKYEEIR